MKHLFVLLLFIFGAVPAFSNTSAEALLDEAKYTEVADQSEEEKMFVPCQVLALDHFGRIFAAFHAFKPNPFSRCFQGMQMCRNWFARNRFPGFCREVVRRFPVE